MAIDKSQIRIDSVSVPGSGSAIGAINIRSDLQSGVWVLVYNKSTTDEINIWPQSKGGTPIVIAPGTKRQIGYFPENNVLYARSTTVTAVDIEIWSNPNKWDSSWFADETLNVLTPIVDGEGYATVGDPLNPAGVPVVVDFVATLGRPAKFLACVANVNIDLTIFYNGSVAGSTTRILANQGLTLGPDPYLEIDSISYVNVVALENFELTLCVY